MQNAYNKAAGVSKIQAPTVSITMQMKNQPEVDNDLSKFAVSRQEDPVPIKNTQSAVASQLEDE